MSVPVPVPVPAPAPLIVGISGLSSSGKTTLSRLLRDLFPSSFILHQDDFFAAEADLPVVDGEVDYDCVEAVDFVALKKVLGHVRGRGCLPGDLVSREDKNATGESGVREEVVEGCRVRVREALGGGREAGEEGGGVRLAIVDGFLLFHDEEVLEGLDLAVFLRAPYEKAKQRREARPGYVTIEGFWEDPPGYFDRIVWPNYVKAHKHLFVDGDVNGNLDPEVMKGKGIVAPPEADMHMNEILPWAVEVIIDAVERRRGALGN